MMTCEDAVVVVTIINTVFSIYVMNQLQRKDLVCFRFSQKYSSDLIIKMWRK
jgi:hypothetical protein